MEDNSSIQTRISALEQHLEDVRKRAKELWTLESSLSSSDSFNGSDKIDQKHKSSDDSLSSDSFSSEIENKDKKQEFQGHQYSSYYPLFYPQPDLQKQIEYLHYQMIQAQQYYMNNEKKLNDEILALRNTINKLNHSGASKNLEESYKNLKENFEKQESLIKTLQLENKRKEDEILTLKAKYKKLKDSETKNDKPVNTKDEPWRNEIKRLNDKNSILENKISSDKIVIENLKKELSKAEDKIAKLEDSIIESRNAHSQINKKLSFENDSLKKQMVGYAKANEFKESEEINRLKLMISQKNKEIEELKQVERNWDEEQPKPVEVKVFKRQTTQNYSEKIAELKKVHREPIQEEQEIREESEEAKSFKEDPLNLQNQLVYLQMEKQKLENEYIKMPEFSKNLAAKLRKVEVESELDVLSKAISSVKSKLRNLNII